MRFLNKLLQLSSKISLLLIFAAAPFFSNSIPVSAATTNSCDCWCGTVKAGSSSIGTKTDQGACNTSCLKEKMVTVGCYSATSVTPENDAKCWTKDECDKYATDSAGNPTPGTWGGANAFCAHTKNGDVKAYCYAPDIAVNLNIPLLGRTKVMGFYEYLALAYQFLLPAMSLLAVVMIMVGGLEYVVAGGSSKRVDRAKSRITNALIGLVLLMSAYTIASLLDNKLVNLHALRVPLVKRLVILDPNATCEALQNHGYEIDGSATSSGLCSKEGTITSIDTVSSDVQSSTWKVGDKCPWSKCSDTAASCVTGSSGVATDNKCYSCRQVAALTTMTASEAVCGQIADQANAKEPKNIDPDLTNDVIHLCYFSHYITEPNQCIEVSSKDDTAINCTAINEAADKAVIAGTNPCVGYENDLYVYPAGVSDFNHPFSLSNAFTEVKDACESDPCGVAARVGYRSCQFLEGKSLLSTDVVSTILTGGEYNTCTGVK